MATAIAIQETGGLVGRQLTTMAAAATMDYPNDGKVWLHVDNQDAAVTNITITSRACSHDRTKDITSVAVPAGEVHTFGPFEKDLFDDVDGKIQVALSNITAIFVAAIRPAS